MDYNDLYSTNIFHIESNKRYFTIEVLSDDDVGDHVSYNNEIIWTRNTSPNHIT